MIICELKIELLELLELLEWPLEIIARQNEVKLQLLPLKMVKNNSK